MKKKIVAIMLTAVMAVALAACGSNGGDNQQSQAGAGNATSAAEETGNNDQAGDAQAAADGTVYHIGVCQLIEHPALDAATQGFVDTLQEKLGDQVDITVQNAQGESANCATITNGYVADQVDLIMANATGALQAASAATADIPILGTSISDYSEALDLSDFTGATGMNISGTSDLAPIDQQEDMILEMVPDVQKVGILYCSAEPNSKFQADLMIASLEEDNIAYEVYTAADSNEIQAVVTKACGECDVLYIPTDNTMANGIDIVKNVVIPAGIPMIAGEEGICVAGVGTLSISYYDLGCQTAEMAYEILVNGADPATMEVQYAPAVTKKYNAENCEALGITVPDGYEAIEVAE